MLLFCKLMDETQMSKSSEDTTLITLLRVPYLCHFGSTSFVLPIWPKNGCS